MNANGGAPSKLWALIEQVNAILRSHGADAVQEIRKGRNAPVFYGLRPQYIIDAVNQVFGPENWRCNAGANGLGDKALRLEARDGTWHALVLVTVGLRVPGDTVEVVRFAWGAAVMPDAGDALNAATTHALCKAFSRFSIGSDAYRGLLGDLYLEAAADARPGYRPPGGAPSGSKGARAGDGGAAKSAYIPDIPVKPRDEAVTVPPDWAARIGQALVSVAGDDRDLAGAMCRVLTGYVRDGEWRGWDSVRAFADKAADWQVAAAWWRFQRLGPDLLKRHALGLLGRATEEPVGALEDIDDDMPF